MAEHQRQVVRNINYRADPGEFSNRCAISSRFVESLSSLVAGGVPTPISLLELCVLAEAFVLNEELILVDPEQEWPLIIDPYLGDQDLFLSSEARQLIDELMASAVFSFKASNTIRHKIAGLTYPEAHMRVIALHPCHLSILTDDSEGVRGKNWVELQGDDKERLWKAYLGDSFDPSYVELVRQQGVRLYDHIDESFRVPLKILCDCHGIPFCSDPFYTVRDVREGAPTNIGLDLYRQLEKLHEGFFSRIRRFLGPTFVHLPSILSIVLAECRTCEDLPKALVQARDRFSKFREQSTKLEHELRTADTVADQFKVIRLVDEAYAAVVKRSSQQTTRITYRLFDIVKHVDPVKMATAALDQLKDYDIEREGFVKMPGWYDLWKATREVTQAEVLLGRVFGAGDSSALSVGLGKLLANLKDAPRERGGDPGTSA